MNRFTTVFVGALALSCFATPAFAVLGFGMKADLAKGVEKALEGSEPCIGWPTSDPDKALVFSTSHNKFWDEWKLNAEALQKFDLLKISNTNSEELRKNEKQGGKFFLMQSRHGEVENRLFYQGLRQIAVPLITLTLTEKGKAVFNQTSKPAAKRFGICSGGRFALDEIRRWSEPTALEGKTVTEIVFTRKRVDISKLYSQYLQERYPNGQKEVEGVLTLYKTSDGWLPLGNITYRDATSK